MRSSFLGYGAEALAAALMVAGALVGPAAAQRAVDGEAARPAAVALPSGFEGLGGDRLRAILPASSAVALHPPQFLLWIGTNAVTGPFLFAEGTPVGRPPHVFTFGIASQGRFLLRSPQGQDYGPFPFEDGARLSVGTNLFALTLVPPAIAGRVAHPGLGGDRLNVRLLRATPESIGDLAAVRGQFSALEQEIAKKTAPVRLRTPTVLGPTGVNRSPWISRSDADARRAERSGAMRAMKSVEVFAAKHRVATVATAADGSFAFARVEPGEYFVCIQTAVRNAAPTADSVATEVVWWANVSLRAGTAQVSFEPGDARSWRELFPR